MKRDVRRKAPTPTRLAVTVLAATLLIFAVAIAAVTQKLEQNIRARILSREADVLHAVALMLRTEERDKSGGAGFDEVIDFNVLLKTSRLKGVIGGRLFGPDGRFVASFPVYIRDASLGSEELALLKKHQSVPLFMPRVQLSALFWPDAGAPKATEAASLLEVSVPLHQHGDARLLGVAQFIIDGDATAAEFEVLERNLFSQAAAIFCIGAILITIIVLWAFHRLQRADRLLRRRTESLVEISRQLALVTKTSAVGLVVAHLLHELKSQVFGLQSMLSAGARGVPVNWPVTVQTATEMQNVIQHMVETLRSEQPSPRYDMSLEELAALVRERVELLVKTAEVNFSIAIGNPGTLPSHAAFLVLIILNNLIENAVQATPRHKHVQLTMSAVDDTIVCEVADEGAGVPDDLRPVIFQPVRSKKEGGSGIALALSKQLALHLNGTIGLASTGKSGSRFRLAVPQQQSSAKPNSLEENLSV